MRCYKSVDDIRRKQLQHLLYRTQDRVHVTQWKPEVTSLADVVSENNGHMTTDSRSLKAEMTSAVGVDDDVTASAGGRRNSGELVRGS